jgi:Xaa-Pro aminopeptidase
MHSDHRRRLLELLRSARAAAVIPTAAHKVRNHDSEYRYRPESDFWYLTGFAEPECVLVLVPAIGDTSASSDATAERRAGTNL